MAGARTAFSFHKAIDVERHAIFHGVAPKKMVSGICGFEVDLTIYSSQRIVGRGRGMEEGACRNCSRKTIISTIYISNVIGGVALPAGNSGERGTVGT